MRAGSSRRVDRCRRAERPRGSLTCALPDLMWCFVWVSVQNAGEGNGNPLQYSCPENPRDGGACWAAVYGVAQSRTRLKRLGSKQEQQGFPSGSDGKESACSVGDLGSIRGLGRSPGGWHGNPFQCSFLENPHGQRSLLGYSPRGHKESNTIE